MCKRETAKSYKDFQKEQIVVTSINITEKYVKTNSLTSDIRREVSSPELPFKQNQKLEYGQQEEGAMTQKLHRSFFPSAEF